MPASQAEETGPIPVTRSMPPGDRSFTNRFLSALARRQVEAGYPLLIRPLSSIGRATVS